MTKTKNSKVGEKYFFRKTYFPTPEIIVQQYGRSTAVVWGIIFGLTQIPKELGGLGYCNASKETIAKKADMTTRAVRPKVALLVDEGWLEDLTPDRTHRPHHYVAGDKAIQSFLGPKPKKGRNDFPPNAQEDANQPPKGRNEFPPNVQEDANQSPKGRNEFPPNVQENPKQPPKGRNKFSPNVQEDANQSPKGRNEFPPNVQENPKQPPKGRNKFSPNAQEDANQSSKGRNEFPPNAQEDTNQLPEGRNEFPPNTQGGKKLPSRGEIISVEGGNEFPQIESLKDSLKDSINKDSSSSSSSSKKGKNGKTLSQVTSNDDEEDDEDGISQTKNQKNSFLTLFRAAGITRENQRKLLKTCYPFELDDVLSELAWCYENEGGRIKTDAATIAPINLLKGDRQAATCYEPTYWNRHIPDIILEKAGLMEYVQVKIGDNGHARDDPEDDPVYEDRQPAWVYDGPDDALTKWGWAKGQLQLEMPQAAFDTWVRDIEPAAFKDLEPIIVTDIAGNEHITKSSVLTLVVENVFTRDWLKGRLTKIVTRLLTGSMMQEVEVEFITKDEYTERIKNGDG